MMNLNRQSNKGSSTAGSTRTVKESRWVHRNQLEIGMYVSELDRPWTETSFMFQGFKIDSPDLLKKLQESCEHAYVQTEKLTRVSWTKGRRHVSTVRNH